MNQLGPADVIKNIRKKIDEQSLLFLSVLSHELIVCGVTPYKFAKVSLDSL
jgi:hypothetical protein